MTATDIYIVLFRRATIFEQSFPVIYLLSRLPNEGSEQ